MIATLTMNPALDESASVAKVAPERKLRCADAGRHAGGGGINVARAVRELGGDVTAVWARGGHAGAIVSELLGDERVPSLPVDVAGETRWNLTIFEESTRLQFRFGMPGPTLTADDEESFLAAVRLLPDDGYLVASGSLPPGVAPQFYARVGASIPRSVRLVVDASGAALAHALGAGVFAVKPNVRELGELAGRVLRDDDDIVAATCALARSGAARVVLTSLGAAGAVVASGDSVERIRAPAVLVRSKFGAGDSMVAAFVLGLARGSHVADAAAFAVAAGAAAVMTPGTALCRREDAERLRRQVAVEPVSTCRPRTRAVIPAPGTPPPCRSRRAR